MRSRFTDAHKTMDTGSLTDTLYLICCDLEQTLLEMGAVPDEDYTKLDLLDRALKVWGSYSEK